MKFVDLLRESNEYEKDPELNSILSELAEDITELPEVDKRFTFSPSMVIVIAPSADQGMNKKFYVDADTLLRFAKSSNQDIDTAYTQVLDTNNIQKEDAGLLIQGLNLNELASSVTYAPTEETRKNRINGIVQYTEAINMLKSSGIDIIRVTDY